MSSTNFLPDGLLFWPDYQRRPKGAPIPQEGGGSFTYRNQGLPVRIKVVNQGPKKGGERPWDVYLVSGYEKKERCIARLGAVYAAGHLQAAKAYWSSVQASHHAALPLAAAMARHMGEGWAAVLDADKHREHIFKRALDVLEGTPGLAEELASRWTPEHQRRALDSYGPT
jgi:hypothetical protein